MKIVATDFLFVGGIFPKEDEGEILRKSKYNNLKEKIWL